VTDVFVNDPSALPGPALSWKPGEPPVGQSALPQAAPPPGPALPDYAPYGGANMTGLAPGSPGYVSSRLAGEAAAKGEAQTDFDRRAEDQMRQDRQKMAQSYDLEAADARDPALRPWNAEQEKAKYIRGPMENFGSVGMIFAMAASAFTRTPMISALNAGAAAMQATAQSDEKAYKQAFDAWKSNSDLALKRFDMERNLYEDANKLLTTDMGLWKQKSLMLAAQFDNQKMRIMLENGMDKEVLDAQAAQFKAAEEMRKHKEAFETYDFKRKMIAETIDAWQQEHPGVDDEHPTPEYVVMKARAFSDAQAASKGTLSRPLTSDQEFIQRYYAEHPEATPEEFSTAFGEFKRGQHQPGGAGSAGTRPGSVNADRVAMDAAIRKEHPDWSDDKVIEERNRRLKASTTSLTGNEKEKLETRINKFAHSDEIIDKTLKVLETHSGAAGIAGKVMRLEERVGNILGAKSTERVQMMRDIELLRGWAKELLFSSNSKLKKEAERVDSIVGGTSPGDTGPNTIRALRDLKNLYDRMRTEDNAKLSGTWTPPNPAESKPAPSSSGKKPWANDAPSP
jgi:hypothetical protein